MEPTFVHLSVHSEYSLKDGLVSINHLINNAIKLNMPAIALSDEGNLFAAVKFYKEAHQQGVKPLLGMDAILSPVIADTKGGRVTLLCQNDAGYQNLIKLTTASYIENHTLLHGIIPRSLINLKDMSGIIMLAGYHSDIGQAIAAKDRELAARLLAFWQECFPNNRWYLAISRTGKEHEEAFIQAAALFAEEYQIPLVATNDVRFITQDDFDAHEARVCIHEGTTLNDPNRQRRYTREQYLKTPIEMEQLFADIPSALTNTVQIAKRCNLHLALDKILLPHYPVPPKYSTEDFLVLQAKNGLEKRLAHQNADIAIYEARLKQELDVINRMGFAGYFLIVADFTKWAKDNDIPVGPGRGSGPGSLVAYSLQITDLDPIQHELLFERFLNPERVSMPDFDIDFCMDGRDRVIQYVMEKHGHDSVSQIMTYGTMAAKAVVRDVGRVLGHPYGFVDKIAKLIPFELGITLEKALQDEPLLRSRYDNEDDIKTLIDLALKLEGMTRNVGKHAGGIVIAPGKLTDFVPLYCEQEDAQHPVTQFDKDDVETVGLVKFDFLGLRTLTIIARALKIINAERGQHNETPIDIHRISLDDADTFTLLKRCQSAAVFQLESSGMRDLIKRLQPDCFDDLVALVALFRPGPLQSGMVEDYIDRKHGRAAVSYPHPALEPILRPTYGVILYQEQVMQIAQVLAGYTLGAADILRRAMGKKKPEEMAKQREIFCEGAVARGVDRKIATSIFDLMEKFAGYGFNKSHSASYALLAYQTAWLKTHYPAAFMAAVLSSEMDKTDKIIHLLKECANLNLVVSPPSINHSQYYFEVQSASQLRYGLGAIKGVGQSAIDCILTERHAHGPFRSLFDFCKRVDLHKVNKRALEAFIKSGAFDEFNEMRSTLLATLALATKNAEQTHTDKQSGQHDFFQETREPPYVVVPPWHLSLALQGEKETLGFYLSGHPTDQYLKEFHKIITCTMNDCIKHQQKTVRVFGSLQNSRIRHTKRGDRMGIFTLEDRTGSTEVVCFSDVFERFRHLILEDMLLMVEGEAAIDDFNQGMRIVARSILTLDEVRKQYGKYVQAVVAIDGDMSHELSDRLHSILMKHRFGKIPLMLHYQNEQFKVKLTTSPKWYLKPTDELMEDLREMFRDVAIVYE